MPERSIWNYWKNPSAKNVVKANKKIAIVTDDPGWHGRKLREALAKHGYQSQFVSLTDCKIHIENRQTTIDFPGFDGELPAGVFVRGVPGGSLEQVIFRLNVLHLLEDMGVTVFNSGKAIERTVDKSMTSYLLQKAGVSTPATWVMESAESARQLYQQHMMAGQKLVLKPLFGSQGIGVQLLERDPAELADEEIAGLFYLQSFIDRGKGIWEDMRVFVVDGKASAAMLRKGSSWITNRTQGATCHAVELDSLIGKIAEDAVRAVNIDYAGVDLIVDGSGQLQVLEVNSIPAWWGLQKVVKFDIATILIDVFVRKIQLNQNIVSHTV